MKYQDAVLRELAIAVIRPNDFIFNSTNHGI